ncbi:MAG: DUF559 domain-containing protein [Saprospiraceae bacterium]|nr:DUF559 domain-containing protein [Saprospiraceae bacterium]MCB9324633.1 DUF559 domain-containing protein [Lewinellaceae bacterium]
MKETNKNNFHHYNKRLQGYANKNRKTMTKSAAWMWKYLLSKRQMKGYQFRRERPVLNYIADFMCFDLSLIIEVDGITHHGEAAQQRDAIRDKNLEAAGFTVLRFDSLDVLNHISEVKIKIENWIDKNATIPPPGPRMRYKK